MKKFQTLFTAFALLIIGAFALVPVSSVAAEGALDVACQGNSDSALCSDENKNQSADGLVKTIVNALLFIVGALSVVMIIIGGILYVTSQDDSGSVTKAKNTILYSVVGLIVSFIAYAIVNWVLMLFD
jgi:hypothetical protein